MLQHTTFVFSVAVSPDGKTLASGSGGYDDRDTAFGEIKLWNLSTGK